MATGGKEAVEKINAGEWFDAILCDVMMPEMSGTELYNWLLDAYPLQAKRLAFITGGAFGGEATAHVAQSDVRTLMKPISNQQVRVLLRKITT